MYFVRLPLIHPILEQPIYIATVLRITYFDVAPSCYALKKWGVAISFVPNGAVAVTIGVRGETVRLLPRPRLTFIAVARYETVHTRRSTFFYRYTIAHAPNTGTKLNR